MSSLLNRLKRIQRLAGTPASCRYCGDGDATVGIQVLRNQAGDECTVDEVTCPKCGRQPRHILGIRLFVEHDQREPKVLWFRPNRPQSTAGRRRVSVARSGPIG